MIKKIWTVIQCLGRKAWGGLMFAVSVLSARRAGAAATDFVRAILFLLRQSPRTVHAGGPVPDPRVAPRCGMPAHEPAPLGALPAGTRYAVRRLPRECPDESC